MTQKNQRSPLVIACFTIFLDLLGFGIIIPVNSFYVQSLGQGPMVIAFLSASYSLMQFLFGPFWGRLSDKIGRRPVILISVAASFAGHLIFGMSSTIVTIFAARLLAGFGNANIGTAQAIVSDVTTPENRSRGMGMVGASIGLGFLFGPAIGMYAAQFDPQYPALLAAGLAAVNFALAYFLLPETRVIGAEQGHHRRGMISIKEFMASMSRPNIGSIIKISFYSTAAFAMFEVIVGLLMEHQFLPSESRNTHEHIAAAAKMTGYFLVVVGITAVIIQGGLIGRLTKKYGEKKLFQLGLLMMGLSLGAIPVVAALGGYTAMLFLAVPLAIGTGIFNPSLSSLLSKSAPKDQQGAILGLNHSFSALGRVVGPGLSGILFEWNEGAPFYVAAGVTLVAFIISFNVKRAEDI